MTIGKGTFGQIHNFNNQHITTQFFILGVPLFPIASIFSCLNGRTIEIKYVPKSVLLGYIRFFSAAVGFLGLFFHIIGANENIFDSYSNNHWLIFAALILLWIASTYLIGKKAPEDEQFTSYILNHVLEISCPPSYLQEESYIKILALIKENLKSKDIDLDFDKLNSISDFGENNGLVYAFAEYMAVDSSKWKEISKRIKILLKKQN